MEQRLLAKKSTGFVDKGFNDKIRVIQQARDEGLTLKQYSEKYGKTYLKHGR